MVVLWRSGLPFSSISSAYAPKAHHGFIIICIMIKSGFSMRVDQWVATYSDTSSIYGLSFISQELQYTISIHFAILFYLGSIRINLCACVLLTADQRSPIPSVIRYPITVNFSTLSWRTQAVRSSTTQYQRRRAIRRTKGSCFSYHHPLSRSTVGSITRCLTRIT